MTTWTISPPTADQMRDHPYWMRRVWVSDPTQSEDVEVTDLFSTNYYVEDGEEPTEENLKPLIVCQNEQLLPGNIEEKAYIEWAPISAPEGKRVAQESAKIQDLLGGELNEMLEELENAEGTPAPVQDRGEA